MIKISAVYLRSFDQKSKGLLNFKKEATVFFKTRWGIHTFFLKYNIDVVILNSKNEVVKVKKNLKPNRIFLWNPKYEKVIEIQSGKDRTKAKVGDKINLDLKFF